MSAERVCVCGHQRYAHSPFHEGRCIAGEPLEGEYELVSRGAVPAAYADSGALTRLCGNCGADLNDYCVFPDGSERHIPCNVRMKPVRGSMGDLDGTTAWTGVSDE